MLLNIFCKFQKISEDVQGLPKISEDFEGRPEDVFIICTPMNLSTIKRQT